MKVCTDSCLFGAWVADRMKTMNPAVETGADIGTGTGLLSLMLAQELPGLAMEAIEIDKDAARQAQENFKASPFTERLRVKHTDFNKYNYHQNCDLVISNPPFFKNDLLSPSDVRNKAHHEADMDLGMMVTGISLMFKESNAFGAILIPFSRTQELLWHINASELNLVEKMFVRQTPRHPNFRTMVLFSNNRVDRPAIKQMTIKNETADYSGEFKELLKEYYLAF